jgi:ATP-binding cassette subfamily B protein RaxB
MKMTELRFDSEKIPYIAAESEDGSELACLAMIAGFHQTKVDPESLRSQLGPVDCGRWEILERGAKQLGFLTRPVAIGVEDLGRLRLPCIVEWQDRTVVLCSVGREVVVNDPLMGRMSHPIEKARDSFSGEAMEIYPSLKYESAFAEKIGLLDFYRRIKGVKRSIASILLMSAFIQCFLISMPLVLQTIIDRVVPTGDKKLLMVLLIGFVFLLLIEVITRALRNLFIMHFFSKLNVQTLANLFEHLVFLPMNFFQQRTMGDINSRFGSLERLNVQISQSLPALLIDGITALSMIAIMLIYSAKLASITILFMAAYCAIRFYVFGYRAKLEKQSLEDHAKSATNFMETLRAVQSIKIFQKETQRRNGWVNRFIIASNSDIKKAKLNLWVECMNCGIFGIENILIVFLVAMSVIDGQITVGMLFAYLSYKMQFSARFDSFVSGYFDIRLLNTHLSRVSEICVQRRDIGRLDAPTHAKTNFEGVLSIRSVAYHYENRTEWVLNDISFDVRPGEVVAIVGPSGKGKTTLIKIIMGLLEPSAGQVLLDGTSISALNEYRSGISAVMQEDQLVHGTILENIMWFKKDGDEHFATECAKVAAIHSEIMQMPLQYNTMIGDLGSTLSGGQKQRIMLARALYKKPRILFLDEATSHLDLANEKHVNDHVRALKITRIIVAHRPDTIRSADTVIDITKGASQHTEYAERNAIA